MGVVGAGFIPARPVTGTAIDWDAFIARARADGAAGAAALLLDLASDLLGAPVPAGLTARLAPGGIAPEVRALALDQLFGHPGSAPFVSRTVARLVHARGPLEALRIVRDRLRPSARERRGGMTGGRRAILSLQLLCDAAAMAWRFAGSAGRTLAGCAAERASARMTMQGDALASALTASLGDCEPPRCARGRLREAIR